jgi:hypothetical protein
VLQIGAQNFGTGARNRRAGGGGDAVSAFSRIGWSRGRLSIDAYASRVDRQRNPTFAFNTTDTVLTRYEGRRDEGYVRAGYGDPDAGPWAQVVANALRFSLEGTAATRVDTAREVGTDELIVPLQIDSTALPDTTRRRLQFVLAGGFTRWGVRMSATDRVRRFGERFWHVPALRAAFERPYFTVAAHAERSELDSLTRVDLNGRLQPLPWLAVLGAVSRQNATDDALQQVDRTVSRAEVAARLGRLWISGGVVNRSAATLLPPTVFARPDSASDYFLPLARFDDPAATATTVSLRGPVYKDVRLEVNGLAWDAASLYRPQYQLRAELRLETQWLSRFKTGNFGLIFAVTDEYRSRTPFLPAVAGDTTAAEGTFAPSFNTLGALLEIRIQQATVSYQIRNALNREFEYVPGIRAPRPLSFYGVRWNFFN